MSVLHRSLEQLRRSRPRERALGVGFGPRAASPSGRARAIGLAGVCVLALLLTLLFGVALGRHVSRDAVVLPANNAGNDGKGGNAGNTGNVGNIQDAPDPPDPAVASGASRSAKADAPSPSLPPRQAPARAIPAQQQPQAGVDLASQPSESLEAYFAAQAKRNQTLMDLERGVAKTWAAGDKQEAQKQLQGYLAQVGENSAAGARWKGYLALKEGRYADAEAIYRALVLERPDDGESAYNYLLALLRQGKQPEAAAFHARYVREHPLDERVRGLSAQFRP